MARPVGSALSQVPSINAINPFGPNPQIIRISARTGETTTAVDLADFVKLNGDLDPWFAAAPDGSIIFAHHLEANEIYALDYRER